MGKPQSKKIFNSNNNNNPNPFQGNKKIKDDFNCPLCNFHFYKNVTYNQLNKHLSICGRRHIYALSENFNTQNEFENKKNDFQLVIDYNEDSNAETKTNRPNPLISHINQNTESYNDRQKNFFNYLIKLKQNFNETKIIKVNNFEEALIEIKNINIFNDIFIEINLNKIGLINFINQYIDKMLEKKNFKLINGISIFINFDGDIDFESLGIIITSIIVYQNIKINFKFPLFLFKIILNEPIQLNDVQYFDDELYNNLLNLYNDENIEKQNLYYIVDDNELIIEGSNVKVTNENIEDYIIKRANYELKKYKGKIKLLKDTIFKNINEIELFNFTPEEIYNLVNRMY
jgi:hypothetical protein